MSDAFQVNPVHETGYAALVAGHRDMFYAARWLGANDEEQAAWFAVPAWDLATRGLAGSSGYVRAHHRVAGVSLAISKWDGALLAIVEMASGWPAALERTREWRGARIWDTWPVTQFGDGPAAAWPSWELASRRLYLLTTTAAWFTIPSGSLPLAPRAGAGDLLATATKAVAVITSELNRVLTPILNQIETR